MYAKIELEGLGAFIIMWVMLMSTSAINPPRPSPLRFAYCKNWTVREQGYLHRVTSRVWLTTGGWTKSCRRPDTWTEALLSHVDWLIFWVAWHQGWHKWVCMPTELKAYGHGKRAMMAWKQFAYRIWINQTNQCSRFSVSQTRNLTGRTARSLIVQC